MREIYTITNQVSTRNLYTEDLRDDILNNYSVQFGNVDQGGRAEWHLRKDGSIKVFASGGINLLNNWCHVSEIEELKKQEQISDSWDSDIDDILVSVIEDRGNEFGHTITLIEETF